MRKRSFPRYAPKCDWRKVPTEAELEAQGRADFANGEPRPYHFSRARGWDAARREASA